MKENEIQDDFYHNQKEKNVDKNNFSLQNNSQSEKNDDNIYYPEFSEEKPKYSYSIIYPVKITNKDYIPENENKEEENDDKIYIELKKYEKGELKKIFLNLKDNYEKNNLQKEKLNLTLDMNLVSSLIEQENTELIMKKKIIKEIEEIKNEKEKYKIDHLTALIVGKRKIDKKSLIKYMLKLDDSKINKVVEKCAKKYFPLFESKKVPYLRLIKYRPIGYGENNSVEVIAKETVEYIKKQSQKKDYNNFVHCIWYCCKGAKLEDLEIEYLKQLKKAYIEVPIPVILINLNNFEKDSREKWEKAIQREINKKLLDLDYLSIITKKITEEGSNMIYMPEGEEKLLKLTLDKCNASLQGEMPKIMMKNIANEIEIIIENKIKENINKIKESIKEKFIKEFKNVKNDKDFINYIISILGRNLEKFYGKAISNKSLNIIFNSQIINNVIDFMQSYKENVKAIIANEISIKAKEFINKQVQLEKQYNININIKNKRTLKEFKKTNELFLKRNFYYISQKYIIHNIIINFCNDYFNVLKEKLILLSKNLINSEEDSEISNYIKDCFSTKLKGFGEKMKFDFRFDNYIKHPTNSLIEINKDLNQDDQLLIYDINNSLNYIINDDEEINKDNENIIEINIELKPFENSELKGDWKYLNKDLLNYLNNFMQQIIYQDTYFYLGNKNLIDSPFDSLKKLEENELKIFFNKNIVNFLENIMKRFNNYNNILGNMDNIIKNICLNEQLSSIQEQKIKEELEKMKNDKNICKIDYFTILIAGKCGIGKSSLINALLKEYLAPEGDDIHIKTIIPKRYSNKKVPFLNLIDTRGIELDKKSGIEEILKIVKKIIANPSELYEYPENKLLNNNKELTYNDQIQCVWYCVRNKYLEEEEKKFINELIKDNGQNKLPIIIVFTHATIKEDADKMENQIKKEFPNIPFVRTRARDEQRKKSYGLDILIKTTIDLCKKANQGKIFNEIKQILNNEIIEIFKNKNSIINKTVNNDIIKTFINEYDKVKINKDEFLKYIFKLFSIIFNGYLILNKVPNDNVKYLSTKSYINFLEFNISKNYDDFFKFYQSITNNYIDEIKEETAIKFLDEQVKKEKKFDKNIEIKDKCIKKEFIKIISNYLEGNFCYSAQKVFIYRVLVDNVEQFSEKVENVVNLEIINVLNSSPNINHCFDEIYKKKVENLEETINKFYERYSYNYNYDPPKMDEIDNEKDLKEENQEINNGIEINKNLINSTKPSKYINIDSSNQMNSESTCKICYIF